MSTPASRETQSKILKLYPKYDKLKGSHRLSKLKLPSTDGEIQESLTAEHGHLKRYHRLPDSVKFRLHLSRANALFSSAAASILKYSPYLLSDVLEYHDVRISPKMYPVKPNPIYYGAYKLDQADVTNYMFDAINFGYWPNSYCPLIDKKNPTNTTYTCVVLSPFHVMKRKRDAGKADEAFPERVIFAGKQGNLGKIMPRSFGQLRASFFHLKQSFDIYTKSANKQQIRREINILMYPREAYIFDQFSKSENAEYLTAVIDPGYGYLKTINFKNRPEEAIKILALKFMIWFDQPPDCLVCREQPDLDFHFDFMMTKMRSLKKTHTVLVNEAADITIMNFKSQAEMDAFRGKDDPYFQTELKKEDEDFIGRLKIELFADDWSANVSAFHSFFEPHLNKSPSEVNKDPTLLAQIKSIQIAQYKYWDLRTKRYNENLSMKAIQERYEADKEKTRDIEIARNDQRLQIKKKCVDANADSAISPEVYKTAIDQRKKEAASAAYITPLSDELIRQEGVVYKISTLPAITSFLTEGEGAGAETYPDVEPYSAASPAAVPVPGIPLVQEVQQFVAPPAPLYVPPIESNPATPVSAPQQTAGTPATTNPPGPPAGISAPTFGIPGSQPIASQAPAQPLNVQNVPATPQQQQLDLPVEIPQTPKTPK